MKTALITGASSGIGMEFARVFAARGYHLIITGRNVEKLELLAEEVEVPVSIYPADLSDEKSCYALLKALEKEKIDVFINNAGFGLCGQFTDTKLESEVSMLKVNDLAMHILCKGILQKMKARDRGIILNVASSAGLLPGGPYMATYYATKAYVVSLTRAINRELLDAGSNVFVCALCPGPVDTGFNDVAGVVFSLKGISAKYCVKEAIRGIQRKRTIIVPTLMMKACVLGQRWLPSRLVVKLTGMQQKRKLD